MERIPDLVVSLGITGLQGNRFTQLSDGVGVTLHVVVTPAEIVESGDVVGPVLQTLFVSVRRFGVLLRVVVIDVAESHICETKLWVESNCFPVRLNCFSVAVEVPECVTEFILCIGVIAAITESGVKALDGGVVILLFVINPSELVMRRCIVGFKSNSLLKRC